MIQHTSISPKKQTQQLLLLLGSGVVTALVVALGLILYYGPSGAYVVKNILIDPDNLDEIRFKAPNPDTGKDSLYVFDHIELTWFDSQKGRWNKAQVEQGVYRTFYQAIRQEESLPEVSEEQVAKFPTSNPASLAIVLKTENQMPWKKADKVFQEVQMLPEEGLYRVELHQNQPMRLWVYFHHSSLPKLLQILTPPRQ